MSPQIACLQECWLLLHIFLGHQGRWLIDHVEEEGEPINSKEMLGGGQFLAVSGQETFAFASEKSFTMD